MRDRNFNFSLRTQPATVAENHEMAELNNPRGQLIGDISFVVATDIETGEQWAHKALAVRLQGFDCTPTSTAEREADRSAHPYAPQIRYLVTASSDAATFQRLTTLAQFLRDTRGKLNDACWSQIEPQYGSPAYKAEAVEWLSEFDESNFNCERWA